MLFQLFLFLICFICFAFPSHAQNADSSGSYVPPPLFAEPKFPDENQKSDDLGLPVVSKPVPKNEDERSQAEIREKIFKKIDEEVLQNKKDFKKEKAKQTIKKVKPPVPDVKPEDKEIIRLGVEPVDLIRQQQKEAKKSKALPVKKFEAPKSSAGVVKGPKTMPSNKKQFVDAEVTFEKLDAPDVHMIDRVQNEQDEEITAEPEMIKSVSSNLPLPEFEKQSDGSRKLILKYETGQSELQDSQLYVLQGLILPELNKNGGSRLLIEAYASPQDGSISADRRVALSRALAIRKYAISQKIASNRIDVRALGAQTNTQPLDRVELFLAK